MIGETAMRILLAQQDPAAQAALSASLADHQVVCAVTGFSALLRLLTEPFDLVVLDTALPVLPGLTLLARWRQLGRETPVVLTGKHPTFAQARQGLRLQALDFLPLTEENSLAALVQEVQPKEEETLFSQIISPDPALLTVFDALAQDLGQAVPEDLEHYLGQLYDTVVRQIFWELPWLSDFLAPESLEVSPVTPKDCGQRLRSLWMSILELHPHTDNPLLHQVFDYILSNIDHALKQKEVAAHFFLSPSALSLLFSEHTRFTYNSYLTNLRMLRTEYFLLNTDLRLQEIADRIGYQDYSYFCRQFKEKHYMTPAEFRQTYKK
jgi:YesN/AraC family two-component response regulator